jgi:hypothetical protein
LAGLNHPDRTTDPAFSVLVVRAWKLAVPENHYLERPKDRLVHGPLQALHAAVINVSILELCNVAIEGPEFMGARAYFSCRNSTNHGICAVDGA